MTEVIADTSDIADSGEEHLEHDMAATVGSDPEAKIEFNVQMRSWTLRDMEELIIEAAARQLVGRNASDNQLAKAVQEAAIQQITARADAKLATVSAEIIDQPVLTGPIGSKEPVTMRDMIGLYAKEYLSEPVGSDGKPVTDSYYRSSAKPRMVWIVERSLDQKFKVEIEKATNAAISQIQTAIREQHKALVEAETARIREAIGKAVSK